MNNENKKKILVLTPRYPFPVIGGDRLRIYKICEELAKDYELTLLSFCDKAEEMQIPYDAKVFSEVHRVYLPKNKSRINVLRALFSQTPLQIAYYWSKEYKDKIDQLLPAHDATLSHLIRVGDYVKNKSGLHFLEMTDAISLNYKRVKEKASIFNLKTLVYAFEQSRLERYERKINNKFKVTALVSPVDAAYLYPENPENVIVCGNGVDTINLPYKTRTVDKNKAINLVFIGNMHSLQNMDGVRWFSKEILPYLNKHSDYTFKFKVIGRVAEKDRKWLEVQDNIIVTGEVDDVSIAASEGHYGVCPIRLGAGIQNKILEYMALGLPCITSGVGFEGLGAENGKSIYIADNTKDYLNRLNQLINNPEEYNHIAVNAKIFVDENFSWSAKLSNFVLKIKESI